jgi:hypothetical protein
VILFAFLLKNRQDKPNENVIMLTKTQYLYFRECAKDAWYRIHRPDIVDEPSAFEESLRQTGNEVELVARTLFPDGVLVKGNRTKVQEATQEYLNTYTPVLFQAAFLKDNFFAALDILQFHSEDGTYSIYEVKATNDIDKKTHYHDLAFQVNLASLCGLNIKNAFVIHLNKEYIRKGALDINQLFSIKNVTETVQEIRQEVMEQMHQALAYLSRESEPKGVSCSCIYKGRSSHCATFAYSNPRVPAYGVHDISRIGAAKERLQSLIDVNIFELKDIPQDMEFSLAQRNQIDAYVQDRNIISLHGIQEELAQLKFPLYFLDYETFPSAIPRFDGFSPYQQIPFQYSLFVLDEPGSKPRHYEFLHSHNEDPSRYFAQSLQRHIGPEGSVIVWSKQFECGINEALAKRNPEYKEFITQLNARVYDLMDIFSKQFYVHKDFKGRVSIKSILPVLVPELSYKTLQIQEGGTASQKWNELTASDTVPAAKEKIINDLKEYCKMDTYAMYKIWHHVYQLISR